MAGIISGSIFTIIAAGVFGAVILLVQLLSFSRLQKIPFVTVMYLIDFVLFAIIFGVAWIKG